MRKILLAFITVLVSISLHSQTENPFAKFGYNVLVATSSKGEFEEFHDQKDIVEIGSVLFDTRINQIVKVLDKDSTTIDISAATTAMTIDPHCEKYYWISPYAYCANNPIKFIDPDGRIIKQYNYTHYRNDGTHGGVVGSLSKKTESAMRDYVSTKEGRAFLAQYASAGDVVGGYTFDKSGALSDQVFEIRDISLEKESGQIIPSGLKGSIDNSVDKNGNDVVTLRLHSKGASKEDIVETTAHELQVHGYKYGDKVAGKEVTTEDQDHQALKSKNMKHQGYKNYNTIRKQLENLDEKYKSTFHKAEKEYDDKY